jgi:tetratricopeptide (TPR) repeat protein
VDVLSNNLDGMGGNRTIDSRTVLARWRDRVSGDAAPDLETSLQVAGATGARYGLLGGLVGTPSGVRINAELYDLSDGREVLQVSREGPADSVLALVSGVSVELTRELLAQTGGDLIAAPRTASLTTSSLPALRAYLEGEAAFRRSDFATAVAAYERAVGTDSTFALAWFRLSDSYGWLDDAGSPIGREAAKRAVAMADRLPVRDRLLLRASQALNVGDFAYVDELRDAAKNYPDDPEVWFTLGELYLHGGKSRGRGTWEDINEAFSRAVALDPSFTPYQVHWIEGAIIAGDTATAAQAIEAYRNASEDESRVVEFQLLFDLFLSEPGGREAVLAGVDTLDPETIHDVAQWGKAGLPDQAWVEQVARRMYSVSGHPWWYFTGAEAMLARGRFDDLEAWLADPTGERWIRFGYSMYASVLGRSVPGWLRDMVASPEAAAPCPPENEPGCSLFVSWAGPAAGVSRRPTEPARLRQIADSLSAVPGEDMRAGRVAELATALEGLRALRVDADSATAGRLLYQVKNTFGGNNGFYVRWNAVDALERQRPRDALEILDNMDGWMEGYARVRAGRIYESLGNRDAALAAYRRAAERLQEADPGEPWSAEAREALARLGG